MDCLNKKGIFCLIGMACVFALISWCTETLWAEDVKGIPVKGLVTLVDLGSASCIPCKMMAPILEKLEKRYRGKAAIIFVDLRYHREAAQQFGIRAIPTQIFYDRTGKEAFRHMGFMSEEEIVRRLSMLGVF